MFVKKKNTDIDKRFYSDIVLLAAESERIRKQSETDERLTMQPNGEWSLDITEILNNINTAFHNQRLRIQNDIKIYKLANDALKMGLWHMDITGGNPADPHNPSVWSDEFRQMVGFTGITDFPNLLSSWINRLHPDDRQKTVEQFTRYLTSRSGETNYHLEYRLQMKTGAYRYFQTLGALLRDKDGTPIRTAGMLRDIHDEKLLEDAPAFLPDYDILMQKLYNMSDRVKNGSHITQMDDVAGLSPESVRVYQTVREMVTRVNERNQYQLTKLGLVVQASKIGLWDMEVVQGDPINPANTFIWSDEFRHMLGYHNESDFPNVLSSWSDKLHPDDKETTLDCFSRHLLDRTGRTPYKLEYRLLKKNGEYGHFYAFGATVRDEQGYAVRVAGAIEDITEIKINTLEKETMSLRFNLLQKSINIALWDMVVDSKDPIGGTNAFWWSQEFRNLLGFSGEHDFPNVLSSWSDRLHPEDKDRTLKAFAAHLSDKAGRTPYNVEYRVKRKTGEYIWLKADGSTLRDKSGIPLRVVGSVEDISNRLHKDELESHIAKFTQAINGMTQRINSIISATDRIANAQKSNLNASRESEKNAVETKSIISAIQNVSSQTNILGINASIEAARAGYAGKGFSVVSEEIRKLAQESKKSSDQIELKLKSIQESVKQGSCAIQDTTDLVTEQSKTITELKENLDSVNAMYSELVAMINNSLR